jgi:hypothetical protein
MENELTGIIEEAIYMGEFTKYRLLLPGGQVLHTKCQSFHGVREYNSGDSVTLGWRIQDTSLL